MVHSNDTISDTDLTSYLTAGNESESIDADHPDHVGREGMFQELTNRRSFHDARRWEEWEGNIPKHFDYYKAGMPCPDYARYP